jgi:hypothetical protein
MLLLQEMLPAVRVISQAYSRLRLNAAWHARSYLVQQTRAQDLAAAGKASVESIQALVEERDRPILLSANDTYTQQDWM